MQKAGWTPFHIVGSMFVGDDVLIMSPYDWQELLVQYRRIYRDNAEQVVLQSVHQGLGQEGISTFTLEHKRGDSITLKQWAENQGMNLVGS
jgi:hypothetical protein